MAGGDETPEQRVRLVRLAQKLGMKLAGQVERVILQLDHLDELAVGRGAAEDHAQALELLPKNVVELVAMTVALVNHERAVEQLRQQTQQMAKEASAAAEDQPLLGLNERAPVGADGKPLAWRFRYGIHGPAESSILPPDTTATVVSGASDPAAHPWRFTWQLASNRKPQEAL